MTFSNTDVGPSASAMAMTAVDMSTILVKYHKNRAIATTKSFDFTSHNSSGICCITFIFNVLRNCIRGLVLGATRRRRRNQADLTSRPATFSGWEIQNGFAQDGERRR